MRGDELSDRLLDFGVRVIRLAGALPRGVASRHVASQLLRSGTSCGANYEEARGGESHADFVHKLIVCWKESRERLYWLKLIHRAEMVKPNRIEPLLQEATAIVAILSKSLETCRKKRLPRPSPKPEIED
jgi:four helix bundle protein